MRSWTTAVSEIARAVNAAEPLDTLLSRVAERACVNTRFSSARFPIKLRGAYGAPTRAVAPID